LDTKQLPLEKGIDKKQYRAVLERALEEQGLTVDKKLLDKTIAKVERHIRAQGGADMATGKVIDWSHDGNTAEGELTYEETVQNPSGRNTVNQELSRQNRRNNKRRNKSFGGIVGDLPVLHVLMVLGAVGAIWWLKEQK